MTADGLISRAELIESMQSVKSVSDKKIIDITLLFVVHKPIRRCLEIQTT